ncbi:hypothetical protein GGI43DRAFT_428555 [Trichoderma evansii]
MSPRISRLSAVAALVAVASAATASMSATTTIDIPQVSHTLATQLSSQLGLACLESMPFKSDRALSFIDEFNKYLQWQSTIEILRNPPVGSLSPTVDLLGGMSTIRSRAAANLYKSQYDFDLDLTNLLNSANDGHLFITPCSFSALKFTSSVILVSLSADGIAIPKVYTLPDGAQLAAGNKAVSPVTLINGVGAEAFLEQFSSNQRFQDPDARYNSLFANVVVNAAGQAPGGSFATYPSFPGVHEYNLTFANGTQATFPLSAASNVANFTFTTGDELWDAFCAPLPDATDSPSKKVKRDGNVTALPPPLGYPKPVVQDAFNLLNGYFPEDTDLKDVAVMTVANFETIDTGIPDDEARNFALEAQTFVNKAVAAGKSKIIVDVSGNFGGIVDSGFALLSVFFPNMTIFSATRIRSVPETQYIFEVASRTTNLDLREQFRQAGFFIPKIVQPDQKTGFDNNGDFLGPFYELGVPSTAVSAEDNFILNNETATPINIFNITGPLDGTEPPFKPEDIIILTDGQCSSTYTIFVNHMIPYGVRVVAVGGRPQNGPMQAIGGVKGSQTLLLDVISGFYEAANELVQNATNSGKPLFTTTEFDVFKGHIPLTLDQFPIRLPGGQINYRNAFSPLNDKVPTHFIYQPADCRLFYTPSTLNHPEGTWANIANAVWGKGGCAFSVTPLPAILSIDDKPSSTSTSKPASETASKKKKTQSSAHKAMGLLLAMAEGLKQQ